jgi:hypothetical protein
MRSGQEEAAMSLETLLAWIRDGEIDHRRPEDILRLTDAAFEELEEDDPRHQALLEIEGTLLGGDVPLGALRDFAQASAAGDL